MHSTNDTLNSTGSKTETETQLISEQEIEAQRFYDKVATICSILFVLEAVVGLIGNSISLAVLMRKSFRGSSTAVYLRALALLDCLILLTFSTMSIPPVKAVTCNISIPCFIIDFLILTSTDLSIWILMLLTSERLIAILRPYDTMVFLTVRRSKMALVVTFVFLAIIDSHDLWFMDRCECYHCLVAYSKGDDLGRIFNFLNSVKACYLPLPFLGISCIVIIVHVRYYRMKKEKFVGKANLKKDLVQTNSVQTTLSSENDSVTQSKDKEGTRDVSIKSPIRALSSTSHVESIRKAGKVLRNGGRNKGMYATLIALNLCFIVTRLPHDIYKNLTIGDLSTRSLAVKHIVAVFLFLNNMINIFLYVGTGSKFRAELIALFKDIKNNKKLF